MLLTLAWHPHIARGISYVNSITFRKYNLEVNIWYLKSAPTIVTPSASSLTENTLTYHRDNPGSSHTFSLPPQHKNQKGDSKYNKLEQHHTKINKIDRIVVLPHNREKLPFTNKLNKNKQITKITNKSKTNYN